MSLKHESKLELCKEENSYSKLQLPVVSEINYDKFRVTKATLETRK